VTIWVSNGQIPAGALPSFIDMTPEGAAAAAEEFTQATNVLLTLVFEEAPTGSLGRVGKVLGTNPPPGTQITEAATVVLFVGVGSSPSPGGGGGGGGGGGDD
jgi:beta-lactam-binding protein with PASTA domain